jgi:antitoxin ParD1/3/4
MSMMRKLIQEGLDSGVSTSTVKDIMKRVEDRLSKN